MGNIYVALGFLIMGSSNDWQSVTLDAQQSDAEVHLVGATKLGRPYFVVGNDLCEVRSDGTRVLHFGDIKGVFTSGVVGENSALLIYQELKPGLPFASGSVTLVTIERADSRVRLGDLTHIFGPVPGALAGRDLGHLVLATKLPVRGARQDVLHVLWSTWRGTLGRADFKIDAVNLVKASQDFDAAWKERITLWRTPLPRVDHWLPTDCADDTRSVHVLLRHSDLENGGVSAVPIDAVRTAHERKFSPAVITPQFIEAAQELAIGGFSPEDREFVVYGLEGKELIRIASPPNLAKPSYAGCVDGVLAFVERKGTRVALFWRRLPEIDSLQKRSK